MLQLLLRTRCSATVLQLLPSARCSPFSFQVDCLHVFTHRYRSSLLTRVSSSYDMQLGTRHAHKSVCPISRSSAALGKEPVCNDLFWTPCGLWIVSDRVLPSARCTTASSRAGLADPDHIKCRRGSNALDCSFSQAAELVQHFAACKVPQLNAAFLAANDNLVEVGVRVSHAGWSEALRQCDGDLQPQANCQGTVLR